MSTKEKPLNRNFSKIEMHAIRLVFLLYIMVLMYLLFFAEIAGRTELNRAYDYNLVPFKEINRFIEYRKTLGWWAVLVNLLGNIMAFFPFGVMLPILFKHFRDFPRTIFMSFFFSLGVETIQLITKVGCFDVDDIILNTLGGTIGYLCFLFVYYIRRKKNGKTCKV